MQRRAVRHLAGGPSGVYCTTVGAMSSQPRIPAPTSSDVRIVYLTRTGCHLCEQALPIVRAEADRAGSAVDVIDIDTDEALRADWDHDVPVVIVDGAVHARYRVDAQELRAALARRSWIRRLLRR